MNNSAGLTRFSTPQLTTLVLLRVLIGWHFLYEGFAKLLNSDWTAASFLLDSKWIFAPLFHFMANNTTILSIVDFMNIWGLTAVGLGLIVGCCTRVATIGGMLLLLLYYICTPPFIGYTYSLPSEGSYLIVNKNLIEMFALGVLFLFPTGSIIGLDRFFQVMKKPAGKPA
jgi:thiosulfate dehydrogenase [quinone] large subunit